MRHWIERGLFVVLLGVSQYYYWHGDMSRASYWLVASVSLEVDDLVRK